MIGNIAVVVIVFAVLIFIHELGHLAAAKLSGIKVEKFSLGFGPAIVKWRRAETTYMVSWVPLGGYIKMAGEDFGSTGFFTEPLGKKIAVLVTGPGSNLLLGFILMAILFGVYGARVPEPRIAPLPGSLAESAGLRKADLVLTLNGDTVRSFFELDSILLKPESAQMIFRVKRDDQVKTITAFGIPESLGIDPFYRPIVGAVKAGSPAAKLGLRRNDQIVEIDAVVISDWSQLLHIFRQSPDKPLKTKWLRGNDTLWGTITPRVGSDLMTGERMSQVGIEVSIPRVTIPWPTAILTALGRTGSIVVKTFVILWQLITGQISARAVSGPVMVARIAYAGAQWGVEMLLALWAMLSINLFVINMLPVPFLDGGRAYLFIFEGIRRRKLTARQWDMALRIGLHLVILLIVFALSNDFLNVANLGSKPLAVAKKVQLGLIIVFAIYAVFDIIKAPPPAKPGPPEELPRDDTDSKP